MTPDEIVAAHEAAGRRFAADGVGSFVREVGDGEAVVCLHGVPASSFLWRKVLPELAARGLRGLAFDLPGLGLADRPSAFDYTWTGLGRWTAAAVDALGLDRFHLVVHDIGGPVGFEVAAAAPERIRSLTVLNTLVEVDTFKRPWSMEPFARRGLRRPWLWSMSGPLFPQLMYLQGIGDRSAVTTAELRAYVRLLKREDGGAAFLRIMSGFERTRAKRDLYVGTLRDVPYRVQVVWGDRDRALPIATRGEEARRAAGLDEIHRIPAKHFLQEDQAGPLAERIAALTRI